MLRFCLTALFCLSSAAVYGQSTNVSFDSGSQTVFNQDTSDTTLLTGGTTADGDGAVIQLGYFSGATADNWFTGTWTPIAGQGSANTETVSGSFPTITYQQISIGDLNANGAGDGTFALSLTFTAGSMTSGNNLPGSTSIPLAIRFYNGTSIATSTHYNTVSSNGWLWKTPDVVPATVTMSLDDSLAWESIESFAQPFNTAFNTTILIPEPSTYALVGLGLAGMAFLRRRSKKV